MTFREKSRRDRGDRGRLLTGTFVDGGVDHGTEFREAGLPHDVGGILHPFGRWYRKRGGLGPCQDGTAVPAVADWTRGGPLGRNPP